VAVSMFTQRVALHLNTQGGLLLGGDMVVMSDKPIDENYIKIAQDLGLQTTQTLEFPSMIVQGELNQLAEIKALGLGFPLRGDFSIRTQRGMQTIATMPKTGELWAEPRLMTLLNLKLGNVIDVGEAKFKITAVLEREPSRGGDMFSFAPRLMMNAGDVPKTKLIQFGSRVKYQVLAAGDASKIISLNQILTPQLKRGERLQDVKTARPEIKSALDKAETFLGLSSMVSVTLALVQVRKSCSRFCSPKLAYLL
jgi:putative ABC transport system permease protein